MNCASLFESGLGIGVVQANGLGVCRVHLPVSDGSYLREFGDVPSSALTQRVAEMLKLYFKGERQAFDDIPVDLSAVTPFRRRMLELIRAVPFGEVWTYGQVAKAAGVPGAARAVGGAMAANPIPVIIPCHRVVAGDGRLTGFSAPGGIASKEYLLRVEHVEFKGQRIFLKK
ncbi:methylated-DNA--[protein]-cysteine S-methyltransferase [Geobacter sp. FeAm09]|uniref:methylated-DNA--[protein]-cysteine S-methyltransferase n=1 Tax=Geobacter sp. FeAm09 TaxID=2597769 RepID=UPI001F0DBA2B|nr:methylated-DNA--[protein]-cysteine S-methyltransferase [Geobacter sp. FeAm09]